MRYAQRKKDSTYLKMEPNENEMLEQTKKSEEPVWIDSTSTRSQSQPRITGCRVVLYFGIFFILILCCKITGIQISVPSLIIWTWSWTWLIAYWVLVFSCVIFAAALVCKALGIKTVKYTDPVAIWIQTRTTNRFARWIVGGCFRFLCCILGLPDEACLFCRDVRRMFMGLVQRWIKRLRGKRPPIQRGGCEAEPEEIFGQGDSGYSSFRIPALVHHRGVFLAFCEARRTAFRDHGTTMDLVLRRGRLREDSPGEKNIEWGDIQVVASIEGKRVMNPVPIVDEDTTTIILLFITFPLELSHQDLIRGTKYQQNVYVTKSTDDGKTWGALADITHQTLGKIKPEPLIYASGPGHGLQLSSGRLIVPGNIHWKEKPQPTAGWLSELKWNIMEFFDSFHGSRNCSIVFFSDDGGDNWQVGGKIPPAQDDNGDDIPANECQAAELDEGHVYVNSRTCFASATRQESYSADGGISFTMGELSDSLEEPGYFLSKWIPTIRNFGGCQGSVISFEPPSHIKKRDTDSERWIVFSNPTSSYTRVNMSVRFSRDGCRSWSRPLTINSGPSAYSDLTYYRIKDATTGRESVKFACMYECGSLHPYERIAFQTFSLDELCELGN